MITLVQIKKIYETIKVEIKNDFENQAFYISSVLPSSISKIDNQTIYILVNNEYIQESLTFNYLAVFENYFFQKTNASFKIKFITNDDKNINIGDEKKFGIKKQINNINEKLTFDDLVIGLFNKEAYNAISMILENKNNWQSLLLYGSTGIGKTHFLHAAGNEFIKLYPNKNVLYIQTEDFLEKIYNAISEGGKNVEKFKNSFNNVDLLLIDDIQFLNNKDKLNEIFFSIFNKLIQKGKTIILSSDKIPNILKIDERMISRFNSGLCIKINVPDKESVKQIIIKNIKNSNIKHTFSDQAVEYIALRFNTDIRSLGGILNKIYFILLNENNYEQIINESKIKQIIESDSDYEIISNLTQISPKIIIEAVCNAYGIDIKNVISKKRSKEISFVRKICMFILREKLGLSYSDIGSFFSNRNHATVIEAINSIKNKQIKDENLYDFIKKIMEKF